MPQMYPINWLLLLFMFSMIFMMFNMLNYYSILPLMPKSIFLKKIKNNSMNWKW